MTNPRQEEGRLLRRITHLRAMLRFSEEILIVATLKELIADTQAQLLTLKPDHSRKVILH